MDDDNLAGECHTNVTFFKLFGSKVWSLPFLKTALHLAIYKFVSDLKHVI